MAVTATAPVLLCLGTASAQGTGAAAEAKAPGTAESIPWSEIGVRAGAQYQGDGLSIAPSASGATLRCSFQKLEGEATAEGLRLTSIVSDAVKNHFRVVASAVGRNPGVHRPDSFVYEHRVGVDEPSAFQAVAPTGTVEISDNLARFIRPGVTEEYSVSTDGVRQDFIVESRPGNGPLATDNEQQNELRVELEVAGACVEPAPFGARLVLEESGRKIAYSRLHVTDATGRELPARMEGVGDEVTSLNPRWDPLSIEEASLLASAPTIPHATLAILVDDTDAVYPIRVDPTFSDENWISMGGIPGTDDRVNAVVVDGSGNLYIGGDFTLVGDVIANGIAKWDGSRWSALGEQPVRQLDVFSDAGRKIFVGACHVPVSDFIGKPFST